MTRLLEIRSILQRFYSKYSAYIIPCVKFIMALTAFLGINLNVGAHAIVKNPLVSMGLALICAFLPWNVMVVISAILLLFNFFAVSIETMIIAGVLLLFMLLLYFSFSPGNAVILILTPLAFAFKIPYVIPVVVGLIQTPIAAIPVGCGVMIFYMIQYVKNNSMLITSAVTDSISQKIMFAVDNILKNQEIYLYIAAFALVICIVYLIRKRSWDYSWIMAVIAGAVSNMIILLIGDFVLDIQVPIFNLILGNLLAIIICTVLSFFLFNLDYSAAEYAQFEDDEYYYYVKAIPKISITSKDVKVRKINPQKRTPRRIGPGGMGKSKDARNKERILDTEN